jgi:hypothetical protein
VAFRFSNNTEVSFFVSAHVPGFLSLLAQKTTTILMLCPEKHLLQTFPLKNGSLSMLLRLRARATSQSSLEESRIQLIPGDVVHRYFVAFARHVVEII